MKLHLLFITSFFSFFSNLFVGQCNIISTANTSTLSCGTAPLLGCGGIVNIGDGSTSMTLVFNADLDLTCLGPIQFIVNNNAALDFSPGNNNLTLAAGSSLIFKSGSNLVGGSCNASERIYIGTDLIATCNGSGSGVDYSFAELLANGGFNIVKATLPMGVCGSGSFSVILTANAYPSSGALIKWYDAPSGGTLLGTGASYTTPLISVPTNYYVEAFYAASNFTTQRVAVTAPVNISTTWNGTAWSSTPDATKNLVFNNDYSSTQDLIGCSCRVNIGNVVFNSGHTMTVTNEVTVAGGSLTFENTSSLVQINAVSNSGNITYKRNTTPVLLRDYTFWSSPTSGFQTLSSFSPKTVLSRFYSYHNNWIGMNPVTDVFANGVGYAIWSPQDTSPTVPTILPHQFVGIPNNGNVDVSVILGASTSNRLIGNPYPSTLDADAFINANIIGTGTINKTISGTLYFWTHNHTLVGNNYLQSDYATYNLTGGTAVSTGTGNTTAPTRYIAVGQGFMVNQWASGNVSFRNTMRTGSNNTNFYKNSVETSIEKNRFWLNLIRQDGAFSQILVGYLEGRTSGFDSGYDGLVLNTSSLEFYSLMEDEPYTIQAKGLPFVESDIVMIGLKTTISGSFEIKLDHFDGFFVNQNIYIEDKMLNVIHNLNESSYVFFAERGEFNNRFVLRFTNQTLSANNFELENSVKVFSVENTIKVKSSIEAINKVIVYNVLGQKLADKNGLVSEVDVNSLIKSNQPLVVKVFLENGQIITKKIIF